jgi:uncharacterized protein YPO0396
MAATKDKRSTRSRAARKGWETRRAKAAKAKRAKAARAREREKKRRAAEEEHQKRVLAAKWGARTRLAKQRARAALTELRRAVDKRSPRIDRVRETWRREKFKLEVAVDDYERYLAILDELADDEAPDWDIAYGSSESAA